ncbi:ammonia-forming cytochrome c nitrite reductase subunit c552 [Tissierella carlieri]|uniref:nitrite reductase (cytochrome; ammonia-forming) n=1 Tax=Tissierella carlieri TaxID=689904 RepID=A0ABT1SD92_9FIRM|nr:ammonia-forming cytochrome c nitrite reductase subunit c552 [Tissierella carlieri]MCQ4924433.1 ammonia-forming cytochrome c nitrite reductase subunit c552 [Tissierella carlieri]
MKKKKLLLIGLLVLLFSTGCQKKEGIIRAEEWQDKYPEIYASYMRNEEMEETTFGGSVPIDYLEKYPDLKVFYDGYGFSKEYLRARGHSYALEDVINTARPKAGASCLSCKTADFIEVLERDGVEVNKLNFEEFVAENPQMSTISCYDCHKNEPGVVNLTRSHLTDALDHIDEEINSKTLACAQCHVEYYMDAETKKVILPWEKGTDTDSMLAYYEENNVTDWVHPTTGADLLKAQHPEFETFNGSIHYNMGLSCADCHMPEIEEKGNDLLRTHQWTSPLKSKEGLNKSCISCHGGTTDDLIAKVEDVQRGVYDKQEKVSAELLDFIERLTAAIEDGVLSEDDLAQLRDIHRRAQFKWDFVFVENGEGFHNSVRAHEDLDGARSLIQEGIKILEKYDR